ncbi:hypothetical protein COBT_003925 [Conglomerata obtusa]
MKNNGDQNSRIMRYSLQLQEFDFDSIHIKGQHNFSDYLSRCYALEIYKNKLEIKDCVQKNELINNYHKDTGHGLIYVVHHAILQKYNWKGMLKDIKNFIVNCKIYPMSYGK